MRGGLLIAAVALQPKKKEGNEEEGELARKRRFLFPFFDLRSRKELFVI